jgi:hypothetical protein
VIVAALVGYATAPHLSLLKMREAETSLPTAGSSWPQQDLKGERRDLIAMPLNRRFSGDFQNVSIAFSSRRLGQWISTDLDFPRC